MSHAAFTQSFYVMFLILNLPPFHGGSLNGDRFPG
jgi:hypothetical protein